MACSERGRDPWRDRMSPLLRLLARKIYEYGRRAFAGPRDESVVAEARAWDHCDG